MKRLLALCLLAGTAQAQVTTTLDVQPRTFTAPATLTVTWSSNGAVGCTADGATDWVGDKATSGTQTVAGAQGQTTYGLTCWGAVGPVTVSWTNPTKNTDGSNYTDPKSIELYHATNASGLPTATAIVLPAATTTYQATNLAPGPHAWATKAVNLSNVRSDMSTSASRDVQAPTGAATPVTVTGTTQPEPPTGVVSVSTSAFAVKPNPTLIDYVLDGQVGTVALGVPCDLARQMSCGDYYAVNRKYVTWTGNRRPSTVVVQCAPPPAGTVLEDGKAPIENIENDYTK